MYKNRNTGTGNGMRGTRGMGGMLYSGECPQTFRGMSPDIPGNVVKHFGEHSLNILHALNGQIQLILGCISILFQKWNYLNFIFINEPKVFQMFKRAHVAYFTCCPPKFFSLKSQFFLLFFFETVKLFFQSIS